ncbi:methyltransferase [Aureococcus anophagefferens]|nr:methyltransferase [Aureococcus anophagefferens]
MQLARRSVLDTTLTTLPSLTLACSEDDCIFERRRKFERLGRTLTVDQNFAGSRSRSTGAGVWECSEVLSAYLAARPELCRGRRVLELGAGCGLCSMVASLGGAARVVATDGDAGAVAHLEALGEYFATETLVAPSKVAGVAILKLRKRDAKLGDLDLAAASADNCNEGFKRVNGACLLATRRAALGILASAAAAPLAAAAAPLAGRFESLDLARPEPDRGRNELSGVANLYFPPWMRGTWNVSQTLTRVEAPLGLKFIGGPRADLAIAKRSLDEQRSRVGKTQPLQLRFVATKFGVVEDRLFNTRSRLDAFAGRRVVASVEYAETGGNNRQGARSSAAPRTTR